MNPIGEPSSNVGGDTVRACWNEIGVWGSGECPELTTHVHCRNCPVYSKAAAHMLDAPAPLEYLREWASYLTVPDSGTKDQRISALLFRIGPEWLGIGASWFQEVVDLRPVHSLPHRRGKFVLGLVNVPGSLLVCVSLAQALGIDRSADLAAGHSPAPGRLLVMGRGASTLVFPVDEVYGTHRYRQRKLIEAPATASQETSRHTLGVLPWNERSVGMLDGQLLLNLLNQSLS